MESVEKKFKGKVIVYATVITASLELLWNFPLGRFPIYFLPTYAPLPALLLNFTFDLTSDPREMNNLYETDPRLTNRLEELYTNLATI